MNPSADLQSQFSAAEAQLRPRVNFRTRRFVLSELLELIHQGRLKAPFVKRTNDWERFPAALLMGLPQGAVIIDTSEPVWYIIAGGEMLMSLKYFCGPDKPHLKGSFLPMPQIMGKSFSELPAATAARISNWTVDASLLLPGSALLTRLTCVAQNFRPQDVERKVFDYVCAIRPRESELLHQFCRHAGISPRTLLAHVFSTAFGDDAPGDLSQELSLAIGQGLIIDKFSGLLPILVENKAALSYLREYEASLKGLSLAKATLLIMCTSMGIELESKTFPELLRFVRFLQISPLASASEVRQEATRIIKRLK